MTKDDDMTEMLEIRPLTKQAFALYGDVIEADPSTMRLRLHGIEA